MSSMNLKLFFPGDLDWNKLVAWSFGEKYTLF